MHYYNFKTKEINHAFDTLTHVVNNSFLHIPCTKEEASIVELFDSLHIGIPIEKLSVGAIGGFNSETTGFFQKGYEKIYFSIHGNILYLRKRGIIPLS